VDYALSIGGWVVLVRDGYACSAVGGGLNSGAALVDVRLDVVPKVADRFQNIAIISVIPNMVKAGYRG
jgi:hypothetical protein